MTATTPTKRLDPKDRTAQLLDVAVGLAAKHGYMNLTRQQLADASGVTPGLISHRLGTMDEMRRSVMRQAIAQENLQVLAQGLALKDRHALKAPEALRVRATAFTAGVK